MADDFGTYTKTNPRTGEEITRTATTAAERVKFEFDGWRLKQKGSKKSSPSSSPSSSSSSASSSTKPSS